MFKKEDGSEFPADQVFDVMIVGGGGNAGTLLSSTGSGPVLTGTLAPVRYVAPAAIDGDSLIVQVAAFAYGSGGATLSVAQAKAMPLLKKVPGEAATQASSNKAKGSVMVALGKLLAESVCEAGQAVVVRWGPPPCSDESSWDQVMPNLVIRDDCAGGGETVILRGEGMNYIYPEPCYDQSRDCVRLMIPALYAEIRMTVCKPDLTMPAYQNLKVINSKDDIANDDIATARLAVSEFNKQIARIKMIIGLYQMSPGRKPVGDTSIDPDPRVYPYEALKRHEELHGSQSFLRLNDALIETKRSIATCKPISELQRLPASAIQAVLGAEQLVRQFEDNLEAQNKKHFTNDEVSAHQLTSTLLRDLVNEIKDKFHI